MSTVDTATEIRPFQVEIPEEQIAELRRRIAATQPLQRFEPRPSAVGGSRR